ncbi:chitin disaccharide deacetylase [Fonticella tunisiensis]|uniref:Carbohydrate deacetylase n=1 Tax=Fonticella tunisiensis TaxID=1096341 RepID=A0A4R7KEB5_9CLOT|nr:chitin disaccharide deacetylase [Fonticella tunisiensis]TDT51901.1 hypothetical protein EDD71_11737 [Fonticella tunisiensis]
MGIHVMGAIITKLIVNADDFGYSKGVNLGVIEAFKNGVVTSTTMMTNMPGAEHAASLAKENPGLGVGIHLVLTMGKPVRNDVPSLVDENGRFHRLKDMTDKIKVEDVEREFEAQIERFLSFGLTPTHLDSHHHVHTQKKILPVVMKLAEKYNLPVRAYNNIVNHFIHEFYGDGLTVDTLKTLLDAARDFEVVELMCHPAFVDKDVLSGSSYNLQRANELSVLTDPSLKKALEERGIELINYKAI